MGIRKYMLEINWTVYIKIKKKTSFLAPRLGEEQAKETYHSSPILFFFSNSVSQGAKISLFFCNWLIVTKQNADVCLIHMRTKERNGEITRLGYQPLH